MPYDFPINVRKVVDAVDIVQHAGYLGLRVDRTKKALCPFHDDHNASMHLSSEKKMFKCFACGEHGDIIALHMKIRGVNFITALRDIAQAYNIQIDRLDQNATTKFDWTWAAINDAAQAYWSNELRRYPQIQEYLKARGITVEVATLFGLGLAPRTPELRKFLNKYPFEAVKGSGLFDDDGTLRFGGRLIFPLMNFNGDHVIGFAGRLLAPTYVDGKLVGFSNGVATNDNPKYYNSGCDVIHPGGYNKDHYLYGYHIAKGHTKVFVVEGYMDALSYHVSSMPNVMAACGTTFTAYHVTLLRDKRVVLSLDNDKAGFEGMLRTVEKYPYIPFHFGLYPEDCKDANECLVKHGRVIVSEVSLEDFIIHAIKTGWFFGESSEEKNEFFKRLMRLVQRIDTSVDLFMSLSLKKRLLEYFELNEPEILAKMNLLREAIKNG